MVAPVTSKTFPTAETHTFMRVFVNMAKQEGGNGLNCFFHHRYLAGPESKLNRPNKDVLYSHGVFDLSAGIDWFSKRSPCDKIDDLPKKYQRSRVRSFILDCLLVSCC